jgi:hypothetical protein
VVHTVAVVGYMRLRRPLPKMNEDDDNEEVRYDRFKSWILIGTSGDQKSAQNIADTQLYRNITEEVRFLPIVGVPKAPKAGSPAEEDEDTFEVPRGQEEASQASEPPVEEVVEPAVSTPVGVLDLDAL